MIAAISPPLVCQRSSPLTSEESSIDPERCKCHQPTAGFKTPSTPAAGMVDRPSNRKKLLKNKTSVIAQVSSRGASSGYETTSRQTISAKPPCLCVSAVN